jgi:hypothetical protein
MPKNVEPLWDYEDEENRYYVTDGVLFCRGQHSSTALGSPTSEPMFRSVQSPAVESSGLSGWSAQSTCRIGKRNVAKNKANRVWGLDMPGNDGIGIHSRLWWLNANGCPNFPWGSIQRRVPGKRIRVMGSNLPSDARFRLRDKAGRDAKGKKVGPR